MISVSFISVLYFLRNEHPDDKADDYSRVYDSSSCDYYTCTVSRSVRTVQPLFS